jgi:hypothetical protein
VARAGLLEEGKGDCLYEARRLPHPGRNPPRVAGCGGLPPNPADDDRFGILGTDRMTIGDDTGSDTAPLDR